MVEIVKFFCLNTSLHFCIIAKAAFFAFNCLIKQLSAIVFHLGSCFIEEKFEISFIEQASHRIVSRCLIVL